VAVSDRPLSELDLDLDVARVIADGLAEDVGVGDVTTLAIAPAQRCQALLLLKEPGIVAGLPAARAVFAQLDPEIAFTALAEEGQRIDQAPQALVRLEGPARGILTGERLALNLLGRLAGVATLTRRYVDAVAGTGVAILDTRKTTPGLRALEKYAVRCGGGRNHRFGLYDATLLKDNHVRLSGGVGPAVMRLRAHTELPIELEVDTLDQLGEALVLGVERILLDNMSPEAVREAVALTAGRAALEVSGGVTLDTVRAYAEAGPDFISVGALTHSARWLDVSLEVV
jgi:nicotinate-nucleotide pyrophosphorylase (carboxylating)